MVGVLVIKIMAASSTKQALTIFVMVISRSLVIKLRYELTQQREVVSMETPTGTRPVGIGKVCFQ